MNCYRIHQKSLNFIYQFKFYSNFTNNNVSWLHFSWPTQYIKAYYYYYYYCCCCCCCFCSCCCCCCYLSCFTLDLQSTGRGFDSRPPHCRVATLSKSFTRDQTSEVTTVWRYRNLSNLVQFSIWKDVITISKTEINSYITQRNAMQWSM